MEEFETYVKSNWNVPNAVACGIAYTHTTRIAATKSKVPVKNHSVNLTISWHDKDNVKLQTEKLTFLNDDMTKTYDKKLKLISRKELVNKFRVAKPEIINKIIEEKHEKLLDLQHEISELQAYIGRSDDIIPPSMKGTIDIVPHTEQHEPPKRTFDM